MLLEFIGARRYARRVAQLCNYVPRVVVFTLPSQSGSAKSLKLDSCSGADQYARGVYWRGWDKIEQSTASLYLTACRQAGTVFDIGANTGFYSILALGANEDSIIHSFEPFPLALEALQRNVLLNDGLSRVFVQPNAVGDGNAEVQLYVPTDNHGLIEASCSLSATFRSEHSSVLKVPMVSLDQYAADQKTSAIDVLKIDVESQEHRVLRGAKDILSRFRPLIFLEILESCDVLEIRKIYRSLDYVSFAIIDCMIQKEDAISSHSDARNHILCPIEKTGQLKTYCQEANINTVDS